MKRALLVLALLLGLVLVAGPPLAARFARSTIEESGSAAIHGAVRLERFSLGWNGKVGAFGLVVDDAAGAQVLRIEEVRFDLGMRSLLTGKKDVALLVDGFDLELVRAEDGTWNVAGLPRESETEAPKDDDGEPPLPDRPLDLEGRLQFQNGIVTLRSAASVLQLRDVSLEVGLDGDAREYTLVGHARLAGGDGSAGDFDLDGALWPDAGPGVRIDEAAVRGFEVGVVRELLAILGMPLDERSSLAGEVDLVLSGAIDGFDAASPMRLLARGEARGLAVDIHSEGQRAFQFEDDLATVEIEASRAADGAPNATLALRARDGKLTADARWDAAAERGLTATVLVDGLAASAGLEPLLARVHPVFAGARAIEGAAVDALVRSRVEVEYGAPLSLEALSGGWAGLDKAPLRGTGDLAIAEGLVETSPLFAKLLMALGEPSDPRFSLAPLRFAVDAGRLRYTDPWTWTIDGAETRFTGSVGLDGSVDLAWNVPIAGGLADANRVFRSLAGESFSVDLGGTLTSPRLDLEGALSSLARRAAQKSLEDELEKRIGGDVDEQIEKVREKAADELEKAIGGVLGGKDPADVLKGVTDPADLLKGVNDAQGLLQRADDLWSKGEKADAKTLYRKLRSDYALSPVYLLNRSRVKKRIDG